MNETIEVGDIIITREFGECIVYDTLGHGEYFKVKVKEIQGAYITMWVSKDIIIGVIPKQEKGKTRVTLTFEIDNANPLKEEVIDSFLDYKVDVFLEPNTIKFHRVHPAAVSSIKGCHMTVEPVKDAD